MAAFLIQSDTGGLVPGFDLATFKARFGIATDIRDGVLSALLPEYQALVENESGRLIVVRDCFDLWYVDSGWAGCLASYDVQSITRMRYGSTPDPQTEVPNSLYLLAGDRAQLLPEKAWPWGAPSYVRIDYKAGIASTVDQVPGKPDAGILIGAAYLGAQQFYLTPNKAAAATVACQAAGPATLPLKPSEY